MVSFFLCWIFQSKKIKKFHISQAIIKTETLRLTEKNSLIFLDIEWIYQFRFFSFCLLYLSWENIGCSCRIQYRRIRTARHIILPTFSRALKAIYVFLSTHSNSALFAKYWKIGFRIVSAFSFAGASIDKLSCLCCCCCTLYGFRKQKNIEKTYCLFLPVLIFVNNIENCLKQFATVRFYEFKLFETMKIIPFHKIKCAKPWKNLLGIH